MPHYNDRHALRTLARELGIPVRLLRLHAGDRRLDLDAQSQGQREFNGLLFRCFSTPRKLNPWDWSVGRSFFALQSYAAWAAAIQDRYIISAAAPARVAAYLLPFTRDDEDPRNRIAGVPGLRLLSASGGTILMQHLPTGGRLAIIDSPPAGARDSWMAAHLELELETVRDEPGSEPLFRHPTMTKGEEKAFEAFHHHSEILAGLSARIGLWWKRGEEVELRSDHRNSTLGMLNWRERPGEESLLQKLTSPLYRLPCSQVIPGLTTTANSYLCLANESLELATRFERRRSIADALIH